MRSLPTNGSPSSTTTARCGPRSTNYTQLEFFIVEMRAADRRRSLGRRSTRVPGPDRPRHRGARGLRTTNGSPPAFLDLFVGLTPEEFSAKVARFFAEHQHPSGVPYRRQRYQPMLELMDQLRSHGASTSTSSVPVEQSSSGSSATTSTACRPKVSSARRSSTSSPRDDADRPRLLRTNHVVGSGPNEGVAKVAQHPPDTRTTARSSPAATRPATRRCSSTR